MSSNLFDEMEAAAEEAASSSRKPNRFVVILNEMNDEDREALLKAVYSPDISAKVVWNVLTKNGWKISYDQVRRFKSGTVEVPEKYAPKREGNK